MFFFHKSTGYPTKQLAHSGKTWTNTRYTHSPNNLSNYQKKTMKFIITKVYLLTRFIKEEGLMTCLNAARKIKSVDSNACTDCRTNVQTLNANAESSLST